MRGSGKGNWGVRGEEKEVREESLLLSSHRQDSSVLIKSREETRGRLREKRMQKTWEEEDLEEGEEEEAEKEEEEAVVEVAVEEKIPF